MNKYFGVETIASQLKSLGKEWLSAWFLNNDDSTVNIVLVIIIIFIAQVVKIPGLKTKKKLKSKFRTVIGPAGQLAECRAKARS